MSSSSVVPVHVPLHSHRLVEGLPACALWRDGRRDRRRDRRAAGLHGGGARARKYRRRRRAGDRRRGQYLDLAKGGRAHGQHARSAAGLADGGVFRGVLQKPARPGRTGRRRSRPASDQFARLRLHHRCVGPRRHQQPRDRRRRRDQRDPQRRHQAAGATGRQRFKERSRAAAGEDR